jgi:hypothetical protein
LTRREGPPGPSGNALAGVLERLLARERGEPVPPDRDAATPAPASREVVRDDSSARRMLVIAGLGEDGGDAALRSAGLWATQFGRQPAVVELSWSDPPRSGEREGTRGSASGTRIPVARIPCGPERLKEESPEVVAAVVERLRRHESASNLLLVRTPGRYRMTLMRAAFLAGGMVVPLDDSDETLDAAFRISRETLESFLELAVWPFATTPTALDRYLRMMLDFLKVTPTPFDPTRLELAAVLETLSTPPEEGFLTALLAPGSPSPPDELIQIGSMRL